MANGDPPTNGGDGPPAKADYGAVRTAAVSLTTVAILLAFLCLLCVALPVLWGGPWGFLTPAIPPGRPSAEDLGRVAQSLGDMLQTVRAEAATARGGLGVAAIVGAVVTLAITLFVFYLTSTNQRIDGLQRDMGGQATTLAQHEHQLSDLASVNAHTTIPHHGQQLTELEAKVKQIENVASDLRDLKRTAQQDHDQLIALDPRRVRTQLDEQQSSLSGLTLQVERMWRALGGQTRELGEQSGPLTGQ